MNQNEIIALLSASGLDAYKERLASLIFPSHTIRLESADDAAIPMAASKIGGRPDLPHHIEWPKWKHYNMSFIGQINLSEMDSGSMLPSSGVLSFFYAVEAMFEDQEFYRDPETCRVFYFETEELSGLVRRPLPEELSQEAVLRPNRVAFTQQLTVPPSESAFLERMGLGWNGNRVDFEKYWDVFLREYRERTQPANTTHRWLGHPDQIQGDMQLSCEMMSTKGLSYDMLQNAEIKARTLESAAKWRLLLQVDSEEDKTGIMWGDTGLIYFWIKEEDLAAGRFDRVICEMQCC